MRFSPPPSASDESLIAILDQISNWKDYIHDTTTRETQAQVMVRVIGALQKFVWNHATEIAPPEYELLNGAITQLHLQMRTIELQSKEAEAILKILGRDGAAKGAP